MLIATPGALTASLIGPKKPLFASGDGGSGENLLRTGFEQFWRCAFAPLHAAASSRTHAAQSVGLRHSSDANVAAANWASSTAWSSLSLIAAFFISTNLEVRDGADTGLASVTAVINTPAVGRSGTHLPGEGRRRRRIYSCSIIL